MFTGMLIKSILNRIKGKKKPIRGERCIGIKQIPKIK